MKFKFTWGHAVAIFFSIFVIALLTVVIYSANVKPMLVVEDYYNKDINYQKQIDKEKRTEALKINLQTQFDRENNYFILIFPRIGDPLEIGGDIQFYKPSDATLDLSLKIAADSSYTMRIDTQKLIQGYWRVKINWRVSDQAYFTEVKIEK